MGKLVSIVVPVYNMGESIESCIESILKQSYENIEVLVVDDGSKDDSYAKCQKIASRDKRVKVYHTENNGSGPARNFGLEHATGEYVCFPDADDTLEIDAVAVMLNKMEANECDYIVGGYKSLDEKGNIVSIRTYQEQAFDGDEIRKNFNKYFGENPGFVINGAPWNKLYDMKIIREHHIEFPPLRRHQDSAFIARYLCYVHKVMFIHDMVYIHYLNDLRKEWYKYPVNYIDSVIGLYQVQKETVLTWNPNNQETKEIVNGAYLSRVIKAMELVYSPREKLSIKEKINKIKKIADKACIKEVQVTRKLGKYQSIVLKMLLKKHYTQLLTILFIKISIEKWGLLHYFK